MKHCMLIVFTMILSPILVAQTQSSGIPHLEKHGTATQLVVDGKPFLMLAGGIAEFQFLQPGLHAARLAAPRGDPTQHRAHTAIVGID